MRVFVFMFGGRGTGGEREGLGVCSGAGGGDGRCCWVQSPRVSAVRFWYGIPVWFTVEIAVKVAAAFYLSRV